MGDNMMAYYGAYYSQTPEGKRKAEERRREEEEQNKRLEQRRKDFIEKNKNRMNEMVAIKRHWAYGAVTLRMTLREALNKGFSIYSIEFENERDDR